MEGPLRFQCPPEFEAVAPSPPLGGPHTELWLIQAPADFCPQSLEGCSVPLHGVGRLRTPGHAGANGDNAKPGASRLYVLRGGPGGSGSPLLVTSDPSSGPLTCAPPPHGCITITQSFEPPTPGTPPGTPPARKRKRKKVKEPPEVATPGGPEVATPGGFEVATPGGPEVATPGGFEVATPGGFEVATPGGFEVATPGGPEVATPGGFEVATPELGPPPALLGVLEEPEGVKKKKKKKKHKREAPE